MISLCERVLDSEEGEAASVWKVQIERTFPANRRALQQQTASSPTKRRLSQLK